MSFTIKSVRSLASNSVTAPSLQGIQALQRKKHFVICVVRHCGVYALQWYALYLLHMSALGSHPLALVLRHLTLPDAVRLPACLLYMVHGTLLNNCNLCAVFSACAFNCPQLLCHLTSQLDNLTHQICAGGCFRGETCCQSCGLQQGCTSAILQELKPLHVVLQWLF